MPIASPEPSQPRLTGIDAARALAVIGMLMIHVGPRGDASLGERLYNLPHGRASVLFVFLAGLSAALLFERSGDWKGTALRLFWVSLVFLPLGLVLQMLDHGIAVILHHYAAFYLFAVGLLLVPARLLPWLAGTLTIAGPVLYLVLRRQVEGLAVRETVDAGAGVGEIIMGLLVSGPYPLLTWAGILAWGLWVGRLDLRAGRTVAALALAGAVLTLGSLALSHAVLGVADPPIGGLDWRNLLVATPHSQMPLWLTGAIGSAMLVAALMLAATRLLRRATLPLVIFGQMALTFYIAHLIVLHFHADVFRQPDVGMATISAATLTLCGILLALSWRQFLPKGPVETVLALPFRASRRIKAHEKREPALE